MNLLRFEVALKNVAKIAGDLYCVIQNMILKNRCAHRATKPHQRGRVRVHETRRFIAVALRYLLLAKR